MKPTGRAVILLLLVTLSALVGLGGIASGQSGGLRDRELTRSSEPQPGVLVKSYVFHDRTNHLRELTCRIDERRLREQMEGYGLPIDRSTMWRELNARLKALVAQKIKNDGLALYVDLRITNPPGKGWKAKVEIPYRFPSSLPPGLRKDLKKKIDALDGWVDSLEPDEIERQLRQYYFERGFILKKRGTEGEEDLLDIDYVTNALRGTDLLEDCFREIQGAAGSDHALQGFFLGALFQEMDFDFPKNSEELEKAQFWMPGEVMDRKKGDCDSKSVAFCSMWRNNPSPVLLVRELSPLRQNTHVLVGLADLSPEGNDAISIGLRRFVLYDIAGPAKPHPGVRLERRTYLGYECIPPKGPKGADLCPSGSWLDFFEGVL